MSRASSPSRSQQDPNTTPEFERLMREAQGADLMELDRTGCVSTGWDPDGGLIVLFVPRLGLEGTKVDFSSETQKMRKMLLLFLQTVEPLLKGGPFTVVYAHSQISILGQYNLLYEFYSKLPRKYKKNLRKLIVVFPNFSLRLAIDFVRIFRLVRAHFFSKVVFVEEIAGLQKLIPAACLPLPPKFMHWEDVARGLNTRRGTLPSLPVIFDPSLGAPLLLHRCVSYIRKHGMTKEGLFRTAGDQMACNLAQTRWQNGTGRADTNEPTIIIGTDDAPSASNSPLPSQLAPGVHAVSAGAGEMSQVVITDLDTIAQVMKMTLSDLAEPVITFDAFERILMASAAVEAGGSEHAWMETVSDALECMPFEHQATLSFLIDFLADVAHESDVNKMTVGNLAIVFAPTLMRSRDEFLGKIPLQIVAEARLTHKALERIIVDETAKHAQREQEAFNREVSADLAHQRANIQRDAVELDLGLEEAGSRRGVSKKVSVRYVRVPKDAYKEV